MGALLSTQLLCELYIVMPLDCPLISIRESGMDLFPRAATLPHLEYLRIFFGFLWNTLCPRPYRCGMHLGMCATIIRDCSLCRSSLVRIYTQRFGKDREMEVLRDM
jgi:hypothetical protein